MLATLLGLNAEKGETPFPWQERLLAALCNGEDCGALDIPTGLGKTAVIGIWAAARAREAKLPRRLVYVVDRRAVVDQATTEAERVREVIEQDRELKEKLGLDRPLPISTLRGQHVDNRQWLEDPSCPAIVVGTVDMVGSRLLFEAYRCSRRMRPYHAALLGADALIVLDEAHLVPAFEALVRTATTSALLKAHPSNEHRALVPATRVIGLSATGRAAAGAFGLDASDLEHPAVKQRIAAKKRLEIVSPVDADDLAAAMAARAWEVAGQGTTPVRVIVFVDSRRTAQEVRDELARHAKGDAATSPREIELELFVGGRRVAERARAAAKLKELGMLAGSAAKPARPTFVIATSAGEVGVDLDADHAVLDLVEWERMVQRLGRVNRRGSGDATVRVVPALADKKTVEALEKEAKLRRRIGESSSDEAELDEDGEQDDAGREGDGESPDEAQAPKKLKHDELERVERWRRKQATDRALRSLPDRAGSFDASPAALGDLRKARPEQIGEASTPAPPYPMLSRAVVESWSMTSLEEHTGRPRIRPWLRGWVDEEPQTSLAWRTWLPRPVDAEGFFDAAPIETAEVLETETALVFSWVEKRVKQLLKRFAETRGAGAGDSAGAEELSTRPALTPDDVAMFVVGERFTSWTLARLAEKPARDDLFAALSGATIVVDTRFGGLDEDGLLDPKSDRATDVSEATGLPFRVREVDEPAPRSGDDGWRVEATFVSKTNDEGEAITWLVVETDLRQQSTTADARSTGREQRLDEHQSFAERHARRIAGRLGLTSRYADLLALAAVLHDEGKRAERWQRAFRVPEGKRPLGKSTSRPVQTILAGYRHELGSLPYAERDSRVASLPAEDRDLVLHLIAAHHGFARPILRTDGCDDAPPSALVERAREIALRFARLERRWGPWGLAWWETLLRAADQGASRENDLAGGTRG